jgi:N-acetylneuraminic acid mutarotase
MAYCPDTKEIIYVGSNRQLWILDPEKGQWRKAKKSPPVRPAMGQTIWYDPTHKRMLIAGGGALDAWMKGKAPEFRELYAYDPKTETVQKLADAPTALYSSHLAFVRKRELFFVVAVFNKKQTKGEQSTDEGEQPSGMFAYDPKKDAWTEVKPANPIPPHNNWFGWMQLCYDVEHDCLIGKVNEKFFAFHYEPAK